MEAATLAAPAATPTFDGKYNVVSTLIHATRIRARENPSNVPELQEGDQEYPGATKEFVARFRAAESELIEAASVNTEKGPIHSVEPLTRWFQEPTGEPIVLPENTVLLVSDITGSAMKAVGAEKVNAFFHTKGLIVRSPYTGTQLVDAQTRHTGYVRDEKNQPWAVRLTIRWL